MSKADLRLRLTRPAVLITASILVALWIVAYWLLNPAPLAFGVHTLHPDDQGLRQARDLGAQSIVQVFSWSEIEPTAGQFHWEYTDWLVRAAEYYDLRVIARIDKPPTWAALSTSGLSAPPARFNDYAEFVGEVAARYRGRIAGYIIWNEPNLAREWGDLRPDPTNYVALLRAASASVRAADPGSKVLGAGLAPTNEHSDAAMDDRDYLRAMYAAGAKDTFDILAAHPYGFANSPDDAAGAHKGLNLARIQDLRDIMVQAGDAAKPVWITEFGYTIAPPPDPGEQQVTEERQAQYLVRAYELIRQRWDWVQLFTVWNLSGGSPSMGLGGPALSTQAQPGPANPAQADAADQEGYSLIRGDGSFRPSYSALRAMSKASNGAQLLKVAANELRPHPQAIGFPILTRDSPVHLGDSEYPAPWLPLYGNRNPSTDWQGEFYLEGADLGGARREQPWTLSMELMQVNDYNSRVEVNNRPTLPPYLPTQDFTSVWATARFQVPAGFLQPGLNVVAIHDGKSFPAFQQLGFTWDDFQLRNVILTPP